MTINAETLSTDGSSVETESQLSLSMLYILILSRR